ncbi:hypothetical protein KR018_008121 [Drosophila ironensis]|nr:hypothetical protein KR018_008121 [Drosophila ironensis]
MDIHEFTYSRFTRMYEDLSDLFKAEFEYVLGIFNASKRWNFSRMPTKKNLVYLRAVDSLFKLLDSIMAGIYQVKATLDYLAAIGSDTTKTPILLEAVRSARKQLEDSIKERKIYERKMRPFLHLLKIVAVRQSRMSPWPFG